jgi:1-acyl-sn-glycerol-3-phosphate acyltransferase
MDRTRFEKPPRWWGPKLSSFWIKVWSPLRKRYQKRVQRLLRIDVRGLDHVKQALAAGNGVLITPNHSGHADALIMYAAADRLGTPFYFMTAWQVLGLSPRIKSLIFRHHGCFSVDREGTDLRAFKQAVDILQNKPQPLVIFPEGEVYHLNERITPFREGPAAIALSAASRAQREVVCIPCGIRYAYIDDPTPELLTVMARLEEALFWRPAPEVPLEQRIYRVAAAMLSLKEFEYLGGPQEGSIPQRVERLSHSVLARIERKYGLDPKDKIIPERVKACRQKAIANIDDEAAEPDRAAAQLDLEDLYLVTQLFSYPGDYVAEQPNLYRMAETLDKFEEDILRQQTATIRGTRRATVTFGEPISTSEFGKRDGPQLTRLLEERVQAILDASGPDAEPAEQSVASLHSA